MSKDKVILNDNVKSLINTNTNTKDFLIDKIDQATLMIENDESVDAIVDFLIDVYIESYDDGKPLEGMCFNDLMENSLDAFNPVSNESIDSLDGLNDTESVVQGEEIMSDTLNFIEDEYNKSLHVNYLVLEDSMRVISGRAASGKSSLDKK